jgi:ankyrin repeat protein
LIFFFSKGGNAAFFAAQEGHMDILIYLMEHSVVMNLENNNGFTPCSIAIQNGHDDIVELFNVTQF